MPGSQTLVRHQVCGSCAVTTIEDIRVCKDPVDVLVKFCSAELGRKTEYRKTYPKLTCFYIFCAGPEVKKDETGGSHWSNDHWPRYGTEFAEYLTKEKLGSVVTLGPKKNLKHHASSTAQIWAWSPDQQAVESWWNDYEAGKIK